MKPLAREDLLSLENYAVRRSEFRARTITHKKARTIHIGEHLTLIFEDRLSIQYQVQEMLRIERIFEAEAIQDELDAYNPLIPGGDDLAELPLAVRLSDEQHRALAADFD